MNTEYNPPVENINGTSYEELMRQQTAISDAAQALLNAMSGGMPHGRDWQTSTQSYADARQAWQDRVKAVIEIKDAADYNRVALFNAH